MKKTLAIVLALVLVLCASAALAEKITKNETPGTHHVVWYAADGKTIATETDVDCTWETTGDSAETVRVAAGNENAHVKKTTTTTTGICKFCHAVLTEKKTVTEAVEAHTIVRGAYQRRTVKGTETTVVAHNDYTHLVGYDLYDAYCSVCGQHDMTEMVPVYEAHKFATKAVVYDAKGNAAPQKKFGNTCTECGYTRVYKDLTTAAAQAVMEIIAAYEDAGMTVEFDADQLIAVGIEEGEVGEVEGCGVATIQFSNWTPVKKLDTGKQVIDNGYEYAMIKTEKGGKVVYQSSVKSQDDLIGTKPGIAGTQKNNGLVNLNKADGKLAKAGERVDTAVNFNQEAKTYGAAYVTMTVDGTAHRVYFYNRHDKNGWVYAFEADMIENTAKTTGNLVRCGAGQEYASVGAVNKGAKMDFIGIGYESEGYNTSWNWGMISDFEFVCIGK